MKFSSKSREWTFCVLGSLTLVNLGFLVFAISEVSNNSIKFQTHLMENSVQRSLQEALLLEEKVKELEKVQKLESGEIRPLRSEMQTTINNLKDELKGLRSDMHIMIEQNSILRNEAESLKEKVGTQERELNQLGSLKAEVQSLKSQVGKIFYLKTSVDDWEVYSKTGITVKADFSHLNLRNKPHVQVSLHGFGSHWYTVGSNSVYALTPQSFQIYVRWAGGEPLSPEMAKKEGWYLTYAVHSLDDDQVTE